jgi:uncharacterized protein YdcH (DUF465 family)
MSTSPREIREHLMVSDTEFQRLVQEHSRYEAQLEQLSKAPYLSSEDILQQIDLKKLKLRVKDQMEQLVARHAQTPARR